MSFWSNLFSRKDFTLNPKDNISKLGDSYFYPLTFSGLNIGKYYTWYSQIPELQIVLNKKADAHANVNQRVVNKKTGEEVINEVSKILENPNWFQSHKELIKQSVLFREINGNEYIYFLKPVGFGARAMYTMPSHLVEVDTQDTPPFWLESKEPEQIKYKISWNDKKYQLDTKSIIHLNDNRVDMSQKKYLTGQSKLEALSDPIKNIKAAYEARGELIINHGAIGILSNDNKDGIGASIPLMEKDKEDLQNQYKKYGLTKNKWHVMITNQSLKWQQMAVDISRMKLFEEVKEDTIKICDAYGVPYELLGSDKGVTFANKEEAEKQFYQDKIIPEANERTQALNRYFETEGQSWEIISTFEHLPIFGDNLKEKAMALNQLTTGLSKALADQAITIDQYKAELTKYGIDDYQK